MLKTESTKTILWTYLYSEMRASILKMKYLGRHLCVKGYYMQSFSASEYSYSLSFFCLERRRWSELQQRIWFFQDSMVILESLDTYILVWKIFHVSRHMILVICTLCQILCPAHFCLSYLSVSQNCSVWNFLWEIWSPKLSQKTLLLYKYNNLRISGM